MKTNREKIWDAIGDKHLSSFEIQKITNISIFIIRKLVYEMKFSKTAKLVIVKTENRNGRMHSIYARADQNYKFIPIEKKDEFIIKKSDFKVKNISKQNWFSALGAI